VACCTIGRRGDVKLNHAAASKLGLSREVRPATHYRRAHHRQRDGSPSPVARQ